MDTLAFDPRSNKAYIIDPTIRYEHNDDMDAKVEEEKRRIYEPCIADLKRRYDNEYGDRQYEVLGIWMGARGTVGKSLVALFERFDLPMNRLPDMAEKVLSDSIRIIHNHIYGSYE